MADAADLNSAARKGVRVRISAPAPETARYAAGMSILALLVIAAVVGVVIVVAVLLMVDR
jgi:hypothetical protein